MRRVQRGAFSHAALSSALARAELSGQERSLLTDLVYGTLRHQLFLDACLAPRLKNPGKLPDDVRNALRCGSYEILVRKTPRRAAVHSWVEVVKALEPRMSGLVNAVLRRVDVPPTLSASERASVPAWLYQRWQALLGDDAERAAKGMLEPEPLWLTSYHSAAAESLEAEGATVAPGPLPGSLAVRPSKPLSEHEAFKRGWVQPQNPASRLAVMLLAPQAGERILDLCSGSGIKAAEIARAGAVPVSVELEPAKTAAAKKNLARLGLAAMHHTFDLTRVPPLEPAAKVLLDAPCSGTGTLRGNPEIRLRVTEEVIAKLSRLQRQLLETAIALTAPGGTLVYAVCTLTPDESEEVVATALAHHPEMTAQELALPLPYRATGHGAVVLPVEGLDGFYLARLVKDA
jgi:16S rRNA (cytosine967-C5)-methyltransferase